VNDSVDEFDNQRSERCETPKVSATLKMTTQNWICVISELKRKEPFADIISSFCYGQSLDKKKNCWYQPSREVRDRLKQTTNGGCEDECSWIWARDSDENPYSRSTISRNLTWWDCGNRHNKVRDFP
jgi:uncharacterized protein (UPF0305 family)